MRAISQRIQGELIYQKEEVHLQLYHVKPETSTAQNLYLRYAFVTVGREDHIFPAFLMDDWGSEVKGLKLYRWFREHANEFPRAEIFGFEKEGNEAQYFLRDFEHYVKLPCYAYTDRNQPIQEGILIHKIILHDPEGQAEKIVKTPSKVLVPMPLRQARVQWLLQPK